MVKGAAMSVIHHTPPKHYLEYTLDNKVPVILVPGILGKWSFLKSLGDKISHLGHPVYVVPDLGYNIFSIPTSAGKLRAVVLSAFPSLGHILPDIEKGSHAVKEVIEKNNLKGVILVAHSKGGLIGKYLLAHHNHDHKVLGLISIATPYSGSAMAKLVPLDPIRELHADSKIIHDLDEHTNVNHQIISIYPEYDNHVWAEKGSFLEGAHNIAVPVHGHHKVVFDKEVQDIVIQSIENMTYGRSLDNIQNS
jgi:pimeloyl-ACP methyl ester carboxylesterase